MRSAGSPSTSSYRRAFMASASRLTHDGSTCFPALTGRGRCHVAVVSRCPLEVFPYPIDVGLAGNAQRPGEDPPSPRGTQAIQVRMQPCSPTRQPASGVRNEHVIHDHHAQQLSGQRSSSASHARSDRATRRGYRSLTLNHLRVYLLTVNQPNRMSGRPRPSTRTDQRDNPPYSNQPAPSDLRPPHRCGCRSATRSGARRAGRSGPPCR